MRSNRGNRPSATNLQMIPILFLTSISLGIATSAHADDPPKSAHRERATAEINEYLRRRVARIAEREPAAVLTADEWKSARAQLREQLFEMLGLWPLPERTPLSAEVTGDVKKDGVVVEKILFQSRPGLYVTANFYRPEKVEGKLPTILYLNGHARAVENGVALGNKVSYEHHGCWFARNGYCCLTIDTLQLGEIPGEHLGTRELGQQWWVARGYTPAGVEAWNAIRSLDYLETRAEVDMKRIGVTGRSGGGAYTWWVAALDDRPACLVPVAGITDLQNHIVDDCVNGHCDCMYHINRVEWGFGTIAALAAPRPCLLANTDKDKIFPLDGVMRIHDRMKRIYDLLGASDKLGVFISEGPHADSQELQVTAFRWMNRFLRDDQSPIEAKGEKLFAPSALKVLATIPKDQKNETAPEWFVPVAEFTSSPKTIEEWDNERRRLEKELKRQSFFGINREYPLDASFGSSEGAGENLLLTIDFCSEENLFLRIWVVRSDKDKKIDTIELEVADDERWDSWLKQYGGIFSESMHHYIPKGFVPASRNDPIEEGKAFAIIAPRGWGPYAWNADKKTQTHMPRKFILAGTTVDEGRIWDVRRAVQALREVINADAKVTLRGRGSAAGIALYAGVWEPTVSELVLDSLPSSHRKGPYLMGVLRVLDLPQAVSLFFPRKVTLRDVREEDWKWPVEVSKLYGTSSPFELQAAPK